MKGSKPSKADALPAICPCDSIANEKDDVEMTPIEPTKKKIGTIIEISGPCNNTAMSNDVPDVIDMKNRSPKIVFRIQDPLGAQPWVPIISPSPFIPNNKLNVCGRPRKYFDKQTVFQPHKRICPP